MKGLIVFYVESKELEKDLKRVIKKHKLILVPMLFPLLVDKKFEGKIYHKLLLSKFLPEIKAIEKGKLKALKGKEIEKFFRKKLLKPD
jgi:hypothetical protein